MRRRTARALRVLLPAAVVLAGLGACTAQEVAGAFRGFCRHATNCDDYSRRQP